MPDVQVVRTYLEMRSADALRGVETTRDGVTVVHESACPIALYRDLYARVGKHHYWRDRLVWSDEDIASHLARGDVAVWVMRDAGSIAGYFELLRHDDRSVEIAYFGLVPEAIGRGLGKLLLTRAIEEAWRAGAERVWLHTCTLDSPAALPNYIARGLSPFKTETYTTAI
jgi:GNAT superfamily N-acetyltransferase